MLNIYYPKSFGEQLFKNYYRELAGDMALAMEIVFSSPVMASAIKENKLAQLSSILLTSREQGMISMDRYLAELVRSGQVDRNIALQEASDPENLNRILRI